MTNVRNRDRSLSEIIYFEYRRDASETALLIEKKK